MGGEDPTRVGARDGGVEHGPQGGTDLGVVGRHRERNYPALEWGSWQWYTICLCLDRYRFDEGGRSVRPGGATVGPLTTT
jgi:hypothetical protein